MRRFFINFRNSARDRASQISNRAFQHYLRIRPIVGKIRLPFKDKWSFKDRFSKFRKKT